MAQTKLDTQGRIQPRVAAGLAKENQVEPTKRTENPNEKRVAATGPTTRGAVAGAVVHTRDEIRDHPAQEIVDVEGGTSLTIPDAPWTIDTLSTTVLQVAQYKGLPRDMP